MPEGIIENQTVTVKWLNSWTLQVSGEGAAAVHAKFAECVAVSCSNPQLTEIQDGRFSFNCSQMRFATSDLDMRNQKDYGPLLTQIVEIANTPAHEQAANPQAAAGSPESEAIRAIVAEAIFSK